MNRPTFIKEKISLFLLAAAILSACGGAPPPKVASEVMSPEAMAKTVSSNRKAASNSPGAVLRDKTIQAVNDLEMTQSDGKKFTFASLKANPHVTLPPHSRKASRATSVTMDSENGSRTRREAARFIVGRASSRSRSDRHHCLSPLNPPRQAEMPGGP